jgi:hypothetical protein
MTSVDGSAEDSEDPKGVALPPRPARNMRRSRVVRGVVVVAVAAMSVACDDDGSPSDAPTETPGTESGGSVTTVPAQTPAGGSGAVEPGTNLVPSSDAGPPGSGSQDPVLGGSETTTGG